MARKVTTEYTCDACGKQVRAAKDLKRFKLERVGRGRKFGPIAHSDLCIDCERGLLANVQPFFDADELPTILAMSREGNEEA